MPSTAGSSSRRSRATTRPPSRPTAFDEAVGAGLVPILAQRAASVTGVDVSQIVRAAAAERYPGLLTAEADVGSLPFADESFDAVLSNSTLDHLRSEDEMVQALRELRRVLRPGGHLLLTIDNPINPAVAVRRALPGTLERVWRLRPKAAVRFLPAPVGWTCGPGRLGTLLELARYDVRRVGAAMHCPRVVAVAVADVVERRGSARTEEALLRGLEWFEALECLPTRYLTGHFLVAHARRR